MTSIAIVAYGIGGQRWKDQSMTARRSRTSVLITASLLVAFVGWSVLLFSWPAMLALDDRLVAPPLDPMSNSAQIAAASTNAGYPARVVQN